MELQRKANSLFVLSASVEISRAALSLDEGNTGRAAIELERACDLYTEMAATGSAERVARLLRSTSSTRT
jgi:hypothetical protein